jgi:hypothetical protein
MENQTLPYLIRFNGTDIRWGSATKNLDTFYDDVTTGDLSPSRGHSDEEILGDLKKCLAAGDPWRGVAGDCLVLWARVMGRDDLGRILREGRGAFVEITGTPDDFDISYGSTYTKGQQSMWPAQTIVLSGETLEELHANAEALGIHVDLADLKRVAGEADNVAGAVR